ncbi:MAG TPA: hypothetical protein PKC14_01920 [Candidatus Absconditabacterales bacterium]|nr:hypothetical protein [Candidatus Absconditabacterales bacterium]
MKKIYQLIVFSLVFLGGCSVMKPVTEQISTGEIHQLTATQLSVTQPEARLADGLVKKTAIQLPIDYPCVEKNCPETLPAVRYDYFFPSIGVKILSDQYGENTADKPHSHFTLTHQKVSSSQKTEYISLSSAETLGEIESAINSRLGQKKCTLEELKDAPRGRTAPSSYKFFLLVSPEGNVTACSAPSGEMIAIAFDPTQKVYYEIAQSDGCAPGSCTDFTKIEIIK